MILELAMVPVVAVVGIVLGLIYKGADRIFAARMQARVGPPLQQPFIDVKKLLLKENIVPKNAVKWVFNLMPVIALASALAILLYVPFLGLPPLLENYGDLILVLYLFILPSLALVLGGFASASPYATVGAQREMVGMLSYEFPLAIAIASIAWLLTTAVPNAVAFSVSGISANPIWFLVGPLGAIGLAILFAVLLLVMPGELGRIPFDAAEAETELAGGILAEYSGINLALFYLADAVKTIAFAALIIALFLPWGIAALLGLGGTIAVAADVLFFLLKLLAIVFVGSSFARVAVARLRITQVVKVYWGYATLAAIFGLLLVTLDVFLGVV